MVAPCVAPCSRMQLPTMQPSMPLGMLTSGKLPCSSYMERSAMQVLQASWHFSSLHLDIFGPWQDTKCRGKVVKIKRLLLSSAKVSSWFLHLSLLDAADVGNLRCSCSRNCRTWFRYQPFYQSHANHSNMPQARRRNA